MKFATALARFSIKSRSQRFDSQCEGTRRTSRLSLRKEWVPPSLSILQARDLASLYLAIFCVPATARRRRKNDTLRRHSLRSAREDQLGRQPSTLKVHEPCMSRFPYSPES